MGAKVHDFFDHLTGTFVVLVGLHGPLASTTTGQDGAPQDKTIQVAIITAIGVVIAAGCTAFASTFQRERAPRSTVPSNDNFTRDYIRGLVRDQKEFRETQTKYRMLREACLERDLDPDVLIREQEGQHEQQ